MFCMSQNIHASIGIGAQMVGLSQGSLDLAMDYLHERRQFGKRIADFQGVQFQYADVSHLGDINSSLILSNMDVIY